MSAQVDPNKEQKQESIVTVGDTQLRVVSQLFLDPEAMTVTQVYRGSDLLKKQVSTIPAAATLAFQEKGISALIPSLHSAHLRFVQSLLLNPVSGRSSSSETSSPSLTGVIAELRVDAKGTIQNAVGDNHVPVDWRRAVTMVSELGMAAGHILSLGELQRGTLNGSDMAALLTRAEGETLVFFVDPKERPVDDPQLREFAEERACASQ